NDCRVKQRSPRANAHLRRTIPSEIVVLPLPIRNCRPLPVILSPSRRASSADIAFSRDPVSGVVLYREPLRNMGRNLFKRSIRNPPFGTVSETAGSLPSIRQGRSHDAHVTKCGEE